MAPSPRWLLAGWCLVVLVLVLLSSDWLPLVTGTAVLLAPARVARPPGPIRNLILTTAAGTQLNPDLQRFIGSVADKSPTSILALLLEVGEASEVRKWVAAVRTPDGDLAGRVRLALRIYDFSCLTALLAADNPLLAVRPASQRRFAVYPHVLADFSVGAAKPGGACILYDTLAPYDSAPPDAVFLSDGRDVVFQRDPFPEVHSRWLTPPPARPTVIVVQEPMAIRLGDEDWNRGFVHHCLYVDGEALVNAGWVLCAGTTFGDAAGISAYLAALNPLLGECVNPKEAGPGADQGLHNVLAHVYSKEFLDVIRGEHRDPRLTPAAKERVLGLVASFQAAVDLFTTSGEEGIVCTLAVMITRGLISFTQDSWVLPPPYDPATSTPLSVGNRRVPGGPVEPPPPLIPPPGTLCAVIHQVDRIGDPDWDNLYIKRFAIAAATKG